MRSPNIKHKLINNSLLLTLAQPESRNAFSLEIAKELQSLIQEKNPQALILSSEGPIFCSGGNLKFYAKLSTKEEGLKVNVEITEVLEWLDNLAIPKVAVVDGQCFGGGIELLSCFDKIIASPRSLFGLWQRKIGLSFGWGGGERLKRRLSDQQILEWLSDAGLRDAYRCQNLGLVDQVLLSRQGLEEACLWNEKVLSHGLESLEKIRGKTEAKAFSSLWLQDKHKKILKKFQ